jgi:hypothetical protein
MPFSGVFKKTAADLQLVPGVTTRATEAERFFLSVEQSQKLIRVKPPRW